MKKVAYIRCPRCELNFIQKKDKYCAVCKAEMSANKEDFIDDLDLDLCPICKTNYIQSDEVMCQSCLKERGNDVDDHISATQQEWDSYVQQDEEDFILPNEETGELAIVDLDDDELDEDLSLVDEEFDEDDDTNEESEEDEEFEDDYDFDDEDDYDDDEDDDDDDF